VTKLGMAELFNIFFFGDVLSRNDEILLEIILFENVWIKRLFSPKVSMKDILTSNLSKPTF